MSLAMPPENNHEHTPSHESEADLEPWLTLYSANVLAMRFKVTPKSSQSLFLTPAPITPESPLQAWPVKIAAPPENNKANEALVKLLAKTLKVGKSTITIESGEKSRHKTVVVTGVHLPDLLSYLEQEGWISAHKKATLLAKAHGKV